MEPEVARWLITGSGWDIGELAKRIRVPEPRIMGWMEGEKISLPQLERLAKHVKRPAALFLLEKPLEESKATDFRMLADTDKKRLSHETIVSIRKARWLQSVAAEIMGRMEMSTRPMIGSGTTPDDPPKEAARREMKRLKAAAPGRLEAAGARELYRELRASVESLNVLVFQAPMDVRQVRGLALSGEEPNAILVSSSDGYEARIFTLLHEYGHLLLREGDGMCTPAADAKVNDGGGMAERWCNAFAAEALMPEEEFGEELRKQEGEGADALKTVKHLARRFKTSRKAATIRAIKVAGRRRADDYRRLLEPPSPDSRKAGGGAGGPSPATKCVSSHGKMFVSLVFEASARRTITTKDVIDFLGVGLKQVDKVREAAG